MSTANLLAAAIYGKLSGGSIGGTAYRNQAPEGAALPYAVFSIQAGGPMNVTPSDLRDEVYFVRAYAATASAAGTIDAAISGLLHKGTLTVTGYTNIRTVRELDLELVETQPNGAPVFMAGGLYRISLDA
jgi:hypothetical protein